MHNSIKAEQQAPLPIDPVNILIVGTFRSGTNLAKLLIEEHFQAKIVFNKWLWKHEIPPVGLSIRQALPRKIVICCKNPFDFNVSLYRFWKKTRPERIGNMTVSGFIRSPFILNDNTHKRGPDFLFSSPTDYWNGFYFAWQNYRDLLDRLTFLRHEDVLEDPEITFDFLAARTGLTRKDSHTEITLPESQVLPSSDGKTPDLGERVRENVSDDEQLTMGDRIYITERVNWDVADTMGYAATDWSPPSLP